MVIENRISNCLSAPEERHSQVELLRTSGARLRFVSCILLTYYPAGATEEIPFMNSLSYYFL